MKRAFITLGVIFGALAILWLIGLWSTRRRIKRAQAKYGNLLPILRLMQERTRDARLRPGYRKWDSQITKEQVRQVLDADLTIEAVELPDGQIWTRGDMP